MLDLADSKAPADAADPDLQPPMPVKSPTRSRPLAITAVAVVGVVVALTLLNIVFLGGLVERVRQVKQFNTFRNTLALGTVPVAHADKNGHPVANGTPVALVDIPALGLHQVVGEGTTPEVLTSGPGLYRASSFPGQAGTTDIFGRATAFGGPFGHLSSLKKGDKITVTTGTGTYTYKVRDVRRTGDPLPPALAANHARLTLLTATGTSFMPSGVLRVDADMTGTPVAFTGVSPAPIGPSERPNGTDDSNLWAMVLWLQALALTAVGLVFSWYRWGHRQTWIVGAAVLLFLAFQLSDQVTRLLPNLM